MDDHRLSQGVAIFLILLMAFFLIGAPILLGGMSVGEKIGLGVIWLIFTLLLFPFAAGEHWTPKPWKWRISSPDTKEDTKEKKKDVKTNQKGA